MNDSIDESTTKPTHRHRRRRRRPNSDPSSNRPYHSSPEHSRRRRHHKTSLSRDSSPIPNSDDSDIEDLPRRFDDEGRPLDGYRNRSGISGGGGKESEMVEKIVRDVGDVVDGRKTWKDLLKSVVSDASLGGGESASDTARRRRR